MNACRVPIPRQRAQVSAAPRLHPVPSALSRSRGKAGQRRLLPQAAYCWQYGECDRVGCLGEPSR